jgi:hypothetical protein
LDVDRRDPFKTTEQHREFARAYANGVPLKRALIQAGYSPAQAKKGMAIVNRSKGLREAVAGQGRLLRELGRDITAQDQENLVRGRLVLNTIQGNDKGTASAKTLGSDKRLSMWQPEVQQGVIVLSMPPALQDPEVRKRMLEFREEE